MALKNLKSLFFVDEEPAVTPQNTKNTTPPPIPNQPLPNQPLNTSVPASVDQRIFDSLQKALEEANMDGFDYFEFKNSLKNLVSIIPDDATRFKAAFAAATSSGISVQKLLESGNYYKTVLQKENEKFHNALTLQVDNSVGAKQKEIEKLTVAIQKKTEEIQRLTQEIVQHQQEITTLQTSVFETTNKIETTKNNFQVTLQTVVNQIDNDLVNIQRYLQTS